ncbi:MAG: hypothetical protein MJZ13_06830 [Bacteroidales bacterium]|nr:hypothetical protein [Bacteroidales bacterium]
MNKQTISIPYTKHKSMKLTLKYNDDITIKRIRSVFRRRIGHSRITVRNGQAYTMRYNPGRQPRTECQEKSWSLFKEANARVAADFANPTTKAQWISRQRQQSRYKTARGMARAYYMQVLKDHLSQQQQDTASSNIAASTSLHIHPDLFLKTSPQQHHQQHPLISLSDPQKISWRHHRNVHWWRASLHNIII